MNLLIIGGGWLGLPLALKLQNDGHNVVVTKRSEESLLSIQDKGIDGLCYTLGDNLEDTLLNTLSASQTVIINIPPGRKNFTPEIFIDRMKSLISFAADSPVSQLIFISTSAVYGNQSRKVFEYSELAPVTESAKAHVAIENHIRSEFGDNGTILRLSGLVDQDRHPAKSLSGRKDIANGQQCVNLIHREDVIAALERIIENHVYGKTLHLAAADHPTREAYYTHAAKTMNLPEPTFNSDESAGSGKIVDSGLTLSELELTLKYPSPFDML